MPFSFIILTYNSSSYIKELLDSIIDILKHEIENEKVEILVFDNASKDNTLQIVHQYEEKVRVEVSSENLGYAKGINKAASLSKGEYLVVVNPDAKMVKFDHASILQEFDNDKNLIAVGLTIENFEGVPEKNCGNFFNPLSFTLYALGLEELIHLRFVPAKKMLVDFVSGGFIIFRKSLFLELGGYDEDYFMYVEDMDIGKRAAKKGYSIEYIPQGKILHKGQGSSNREFAIVNIYKGLVIYYSKHGSKMEQYYVKSLLRLKATLIIFVATVMGRKEMITTYSKALKAIS